MPAEKPGPRASDEMGDMRGELRDFRQATTTSFNALREGMTDLRTHVDNGFTEMRGKLDATAAGQRQIVQILGRLTEQG